MEVDVASLISLANQMAALAGRDGVDPLTRQGLADVHMRATIVRLIGYRLLTALVQGREPGPEGSIAKLAVGQLFKRASELALSIEGPAGMLGEEEGLAGGWRDIFLVSPALRILGGTDEIQHNIIGERVLGLPREDDPGRTRAFDDQPDKALAG
jgi:alkylation response protein AidB-like acyl-CoA dehydrogenase